jgi:broad specificity phosphatase PhoE
MKIYITRHGQTKWNLEGRMQGWKNSDLSEKGAENARKLGESLKDIDFDCIYCSPLGRAVDTAKHIRGSKDTNIIIEENLKEMGFGAWEGMETTKIEELYPEERFNFWNKPHLFQPVGGESFEQVFDRVRKALDNIISSKPGENVLIVAHAVVLKTIYAIVKNYPLEHLWNPPFMYDTSLTVLEVRDNEVSIILEGDVSHLS